jgi:hypothetical protein
VDEALAFIAKTTIGIAETSDGRRVDKPLGGNDERNDDMAAEATTAINIGVAKIAVNKAEHLLLCLFAVIGSRILGFEEEQGHDFRSVEDHFRSVLGFSSRSEVANLGGSKTTAEQEKEGEPSHKACFFLEMKEGRNLVFFTLKFI